MNIEFRFWMLFLKRLHLYDVVSVSGFARGIDQKAHQLSLHGIPTIAILWWGLSHYLRGADRHFLEKIVDNGWLVLSEFKLWFTPTKWSFPQRNKLIAMISQMLFLPEAREKSCLITAEFAHTFKSYLFIRCLHPFFSSECWNF